MNIIQQISEFYNSHVFLFLLFICGHYTMNTDYHNFSATLIPMASQQLGNNILFFPESQTLGDRCPSSVPHVLMILLVPVVQPDCLELQLHTASGICAATHPAQWRYTVATDGDARSKLKHHTRRRRLSRQVRVGVGKVGPMESCSTSPSHPSARAAAARRQGRTKR